MSASAARTEDHGQAQEEAEFRILVPCHLKESGDTLSVGRRDSAEPVDGAVACLTGL
jgi:hypothetical protein